MRGPSAPPLTAAAASPQLRRCCCPRRRRVPAFSRPAPPPPRTSRSHGRLRSERRSGPSSARQCQWPLALCRGSLPMPLGFTSESTRMGAAPGCCRTMAVPDRAAWGRGPAHWRRRRCPGRGELLLSWRRRLRLIAHPVAAAEGGWSRAVQAVESFSKARGGKLRPVGCWSEPAARGPRHQAPMWCVLRRRPGRSPAMLLLVESAGHVRASGLTLPSRSCQLLGLILILL